MQIGLSRSSGAYRPAPPCPRQRPARGRLPPRHRRSRPAQSRERLLPCPEAFEESISSAECVPPQPATSAVRLGQVLTRSFPPTLFALSRSLPISRRVIDCQLMLSCHPRFPSVRSSLSLPWSWTLPSMVRHNTRELNPPPKKLRLLSSSRVLVFLGDSECPKIGLPHDPRRFFGSSPPADRFSRFFDQASNVAGIFCVVMIGLRTLPPLEPRATP